MGESPNIDRRKFLAALAAGVYAAPMSIRLLAPTPAYAQVGCSSSAGPSQVCSIPSTSFPSSVSSGSYPLAVEAPELAGEGTGEMPLDSERNEAERSAGGTSWSAAALLAANLGVGAAIVLRKRNSEPAERSESSGPAASEIDT